MCSVNYIIFLVIKMRHFQTTDFPQIVFNNNLKKGFYDCLFIDCCIVDAFTTLACVTERIFPLQPSLWNPLLISRR